MATKTSLNSCDYKKFFINKIKTYAHDISIYLFSVDLINKNSTSSVEQLTKLDLDK